METSKNGSFVVKRYAVREAEKWRYAVRKVKIGRYAVRKGEGGVTLLYYIIFCNWTLFFFVFFYSDCLGTGSNCWKQFYFK